MNRKVIIFLLWCLCLPAFSFANPEGPFEGHVYDSQTGEPVNGAAVLIYWVKCLPGFDGCNSKTAAAIHLRTDSSGRYEWKKAYIDTDLLATMDTCNIVIYQPGYIAYTARHEYYWPWSSPRPTFPSRNNIVKLKRVSPEFDHGKQYDSLKRTLRHIAEDLGYFKNSAKDISAAANERLLEQLEWENMWESPQEKRFSSGSKEMPEEKSAAVFQGLASRDQTMRLRAVRELGDYKSSRTRDLLIALLDDADFLVRLEAARLLGDIGEQSESVLALLNKIVVDDVWPYTLLQRQALRSLEKIFGNATYEVYQQRTRKEKFRLALKFKKVILESQQQKKMVEILLQNITDPYLKEGCITLLGLVGDRTHLQYLYEELTNRSDQVRDAALKSLSDIVLDDETVLAAGSKQYEDIDTLAEKAIDALHDRSPVVKKRAAEILGKAKRDKAVMPLLESLGVTDLAVKLAVVRALGEFQDKEIVAPLLAVAADTNASPEMRKEALQVLGRYGDKRIVTTLPSLFKSFRLGDDGNNVVRTTFFDAEWATQEGWRVTYRHRGKRSAGGIQVGGQFIIAEACYDIVIRRVNPTAVKSLIAVAEDSSRSTRNAIDRRAEAAELLLRYEDPRIETLALRLLKDASPRLRIIALRLIKDTAAEDKAAKFFIQSALQDTDRAVRREAEELLGTFRDEDILRQNLERLASDNPVERKAVWEYLEQISSEDTLISELNWTRKSIVENFRKESPQLKRVALKVVQNILGKDAVPVLLECLNDKDPKVRLQALHSLDDLGDTKAMETILNKIYDEDKWVAMAAFYALRKYDDSRIVDACLEFLQNTENSSVLRQEAVDCIRDHPSTKAVKPLTALLAGADTDISLKAAAVEALGKIGDPGVVDVLIPLLEMKLPDQKKATMSRGCDLKRNVLAALGEIGDKRAYPHLAAALADSKLEIFALEALGDLNDTRALPLLKEYLAKDRVLRNYALHALSKLDDHEVLNILIPLSEDRVFNDDPGSREYLFQAFSKFVRHADPRVSERARIALDKIQDGQQQQATQGEISASIAFPRDARDQHQKATETELSPDKPVTVVTLKNNDGLWDIRMIKPYLAFSGAAKIKPQKQGKQYMMASGAQFGSGTTWQMQVRGNGVLAKGVQVRKLIDDPKTKIPSFITLTRKRVGVEEQIDQLPELPNHLKQQVINNLAYLGDVRVKEVIILMINDAEPRLRRSAVRALGFVASEQDIALLRDIINDGDQQVKALAVWALGELNDSEGMKYILPLVGDENKHIRYAAVSALVNMGTPQGNKMLENVLGGHQDYRVRQTAAQILGLRKSADFMEPLISLLNDQDPYVRQSAARALGRIGNRSVLEALLGKLDEPDEEARFWVFQALSELNDFRAVSRLVPLVIDSDTTRQDLALETLRSLHDSEARTAIARFFLENFHSSRPENLQIAAQLTDVLGESGVIAALRDHDGDSKRTVRNLLGLLLVRSNDKRFQTIGFNALINFEDREVVITELSAAIIDRKEGFSRAVRLLSRLCDLRSLPTFIHMVKQRDKYDQYSIQLACEVLGKMVKKDAAPAIFEMFHDPSTGEYLKVEAIKTLGKIGYREIGPDLIDILNNSNSSIDLLKSAVIAVGQVKENSAVPLLIRIVSDKDNDVWLRTAAVGSLGEIGDKSTVVFLDNINNSLGYSKDDGYLKNALQKTLQKLRSDKIE